VLGDELLRDVAVGDAVAIGAVDDLVVDVRVVAHVGDLEAARLQVAVDHVEDHVGAGVPDVAVVVDGDAADVHADLTGGDGCELFLAAGQGIVDA
jgi:hypothetical protein